MVSPNAPLVVGDALVPHQFKQEISLSWTRVVYLFTPCTGLREDMGAIVQHKFDAIATDGCVWRTLG